MAVAYGPASQAQIDAASNRPHRRHHVWLWGIGIFIAGIVALNGIANASQPPTGCQHRCGIPPPPKSPPLSQATIYRSSSLGFQLAYNPNFAGTPTNVGASSISWSFALKGGGFLDAKVSGSRSNGQSPDQTISSLQTSSFSQFKAEYSVPAAEVGLVPGAGEIYQGSWSPLIGQSSTERLALMAATRTGVTVTIACEAPKVPDNGEHANPAELGTGADQFCDNVLNTVAWK